MRSSRQSGLLAAVVALLLTAAPASAQAPAPGKSTVVARVGSLVVTAADLERRMASVPPYQLRTFGRTPEEIRKNFLERVFIREMLLAEGALAEKLGERADVQERVRGLLRSAMLGQLRFQAESTPVSDERVKDYYDKNHSKFHSPERIAIWRILAATRDEAKKIIDEVRNDKSGKRWTDLARESQDKATAMRNGNLGFVDPDGGTAEAGVKVDPKLFAAAKLVQDGEILGEPVPEGARFAVIWRRQTMKPVVRTLEQEAPAIRQVLAHKRTEEAIHELLERLRTETGSVANAELVDQLEITSNGEIQPARRPGGLPVSRRPGGGAPVPVPGPAGLR